MISKSKYHFFEISKELFFLRIGIKRRVIILLGKGLKYTHRLFTIENYRDYSKSELYFNCFGLLIYLTLYKD